MSEKKSEWWEPWNPDVESLEEHRDRLFLAAPVLDGAEVDTLIALRKVTWDGDLPSKAARSSLVEKGLAVRWNGFQVVSDKGMALLQIMGKLQEMGQMVLRRR